MKIGFWWSSVHGCGHRTARLAQCVILVMNYTPMFFFCVVCSCPERPVFGATLVSPPEKTRQESAS